MPVILKDGVKILTDTIKGGLRHQDYPYVNKIAKDFTTYATGQGITEKLERFNGGETLELFKQRVILTITNTVDLVSGVVSPFDQVARTAATISMTWAGLEATTIAKNKILVESAADKFWGQKSVSDYLGNRKARVDSQDPNSFFVVEFKESVNSDDPEAPLINPYPFEVNSEEAIDYIYKNNDLQYLTVLNKIMMIDDKGAKVPGEKYFMYMANENLTATQIHAKTIDSFITLNPSTIYLSGITDFGQLVPGANYLYQVNPDVPDSNVYIINVYSHKIGLVPAKVFGTITDPITRHRTRLPMIFAAQCYFEDSIQTMSEFSITKRLHTFPQKWQYLPKCDKCYNGKLRLDGSECKSCNGTGTTTHASSQDIVGIRMPDELKDIVNLEMMATYKGPPIDLVKFQKEFGFEDIKRYVASAVFNSKLAKMRVKTATESENDYESIYNTLQPYADNYSDDYKFIYKIIAILRNVGDKFEIVHQFPDDFGLESFDEILDQLKKASESGAPSHVKKALYRKLTNKTYLDHPREILKIDTKDKYYPFVGKTETEIQFIIANGKATKYAATLYSLFDLIFADLEYESSLEKRDFYELDETLQRDKLKAKVEFYIKQIDDEIKAEAAAAFAAAPKDTTVA